MRWYSAYQWHQIPYMRFSIYSFTYDRNNMIQMITQKRYILAKKHLLMPNHIDASHQIASNPPSTSYPALTHPPHSTSLNSSPTSRYH